MLIISTFTMNTMTAGALEVTGNVHWHHQQTALMLELLHHRLASRMIEVVHQVQLNSVLVIVFHRPPNKWAHLAVEEFRHHNCLHSLIHTVLRTANKCQRTHIVSTESKMNLMKKIKRQNEIPESGRNSKSSLPVDFSSNFTVKFINSLNYLLMYLLFTFKYIFLERENRKLINKNKQMKPDPQWTIIKSFHSRVKWFC